MKETKQCHCVYFKILNVLLLFLSKNNNVKRQNLKMLNVSTRRGIFLRILKWSVIPSDQCLGSLVAWDKLDESE